MKYKVIWKHSAEQELARIWTNATDRGAVTAAANAMDTASGSLTMIAALTCWKSGARNGRINWTSERGKEDNSWVYWSSKRVCDRN
jgi:hypothetical protein